MEIISQPESCFLSQSQIDSFNQHGFIAIDRITDETELAWMREDYDRIFAERAGRDTGDQFDLAGTDEDGAEEALPQILGPSRYAPRLASSVYRANADVIARQLLGSDARFTGDHAILKPARRGSKTPWHQDEAYWNPAYEYNAISVWMPLQPADRSNGCMEFIAGSHRREVEPHHPIDHDPRIHGLVIDELPTQPPVSCPLPAGGATVHLSRTLHYTGPNLSDSPRRSYILTYGTPSRLREQPRVFPWLNSRQTAREVRAAKSEPPRT